MQALRGVTIDAAWALRVENEVGSIVAGKRADFVLLRTDGIPLYNFGCVVDDHDMGVTHVVRGSDHLNNAARQTLLYKAMGWDVPVLEGYRCALGLAKLMVDLKLKASGLLYPGDRPVKWRRKKYP